MVVGLFTHTQKFTMKTEGINFDYVQIGETYSKNGVKYTVLSKSDEITTHDMGGWSTKKITLYNPEMGKIVMNCVKKGGLFIADIWWKNETEKNFTAINNLALQKGQEIKFLDYTIKNSHNNDGLVLFKEGDSLYENHLGNYGAGTEENITRCKKYAIHYFMLARPQHFASNLAIRLNTGAGLYREFSTFKQVCEKEGIEMPVEITGEDISGIICFNGRPV